MNNTRLFLHLIYNFKKEPITNREDHWQKYRFNHDHPITRINEESKATYLLVDKNIANYSERKMSYLYNICML